MRRTPQLEHPQPEHCPLQEEHEEQEQGAILIAWMFEGLVMFM